MKRRHLLAALAITLPTLAATRPVRIAWIAPIDAATHANYIAAFKDGMRELSRIEGRDYVLEVQYAEGHYERFPAMIAAALARDSALIIVVTIASVRAAQSATTSVPIVFVATNDPLGSGLVASLARPGGNTTGISNQAEDVIVKYVEMLREAVPNVRRLAVLQNPDNPSNRRMFDRVRAAAQTLGMSATAYEASTPEDIVPALQTMALQRPDALLVNSDAMIFQYRERIAAFALEHGTPTIGTSPETAYAGFLLAYGADRPEMYRRAASYVVKILNGAHPGDLPVEQPTRFKLAINLKTARSLGVTIAPLLLLRADEVIQ